MLRPKRNWKADEVRKILSKAPGVVVVDDPKKFEYPLRSHAAGKDETFVGRIREDESIPNGINLWVRCGQHPEGCGTQRRPDR